VINRNRSPRAALGAVSTRPSCAVHVKSRAAVGGWREDFSRGCRPVPQSGRVPRSISPNRFTADEGFLWRLAAMRQPVGDGAWPSAKPAPRTPGRRKDQRRPWKVAPGVLWARPDLHQRQPPRRDCSPCLLPIQSPLQQGLARLPLRRFRWALDEAGELRLTQTQRNLLWSAFRAGATIAILSASSKSSARHLRSKGRAKALS
jgi:hypothetical protein